MHIVTIKDPDHDILLKPATRVQFPLSDETKQLVEQMERFVIEHDKTHGVAGMAAPQLDVDLRIVFIQVGSDWGKFRKNVFDAMPLTPLFNPSYRGLPEEGMDKDFEACFSVPDLAIEVYRYNTIHYYWQDEYGVEHSGVAKGFLARLLQHEIDHLDGILHSSLAKDDCEVLTIEELMLMRAKMREQAELDR